jgi:hypothetical protein
MIDDEARLVAKYMSLLDFVRLYRRHVSLGDLHSAEALLKEAHPVLARSLRGSQCPNSCCP